MGCPNLGHCRGGTVFSKIDEWKMSRAHPPQANHAEIVTCLRKGGRRELRELTRCRKSIIKECSREMSRLQKELECAGKSSQKKFPF